MAGHEMCVEDLESLRYEITQTSDELEQWAEYQIIGKKMILRIKIARDQEDSDIIFIAIDSDEVTENEIRLLSVIGTEHLIKPKLKF